MDETPINHGSMKIRNPANTPDDAADLADSVPQHDYDGGYTHCACGAVLCRPISIREGECQACRNERVRLVPGYGR